MPRLTSLSRSAASRLLPHAVRGVIFDLDGTLVDSGLDFDVMRREMGIAPGQALLGSDRRASRTRRRRCRAILARHEWAGAERGHADARRAGISGGPADRGIHRAVFTRNSRAVALATLGRLSLDFDTVVAREDARPSPTRRQSGEFARNGNCSRRRWSSLATYRFDIEAGHRAGVRTVLYTAAAISSHVLAPTRPTLACAASSSPQELLSWLAEPL